MHKKAVFVNERNIPIGEDHHRAKLADSDIQLILWLREQGLNYSQIADKFDDNPTVSKKHVRMICLGLSRNVTPAGQRPARK